MNAKGNSGDGRRSPDRRVWALSLLVLVALAAALTWWLARPPVPDAITLFAGPEGSAFYRDGLRYREVLAGYGVTVNVVPTAGTVENLRRLRESAGPRAGFAEAFRAPAAPGADAPDDPLRSLGSLYVEPFWVFARRGLTVADVPDLKGLAVAPGEEGSGVRVFAEALLAANGLSGQVRLVDTDALDVGALRGLVAASGVDALFASGDPDSPLVDGLLRLPEFRAISLPRIDSYAFRYPGVRPLRIPQGAHDLARNIPEADLNVIGLAVELVVPEDLPAALSDVLLEAAREVHGGKRRFAARREYPSPELASRPLSRAATRYYERGPSPLWRVLPFRWATRVDRFVWVMTSVASVALALFGILPKLLSMGYKRASQRLHRRLEGIEKAVATGGDKTALLQELTDIDQASAGLRVPKALLPGFFDLRQNLHDIRERVLAM
jgi:TRAP-type uncharacterized transport system substrate-binding protein